MLAGLNQQTIDNVRREELQERLEFPDSDLRRRLREYSTGMKRKLGLMQAFQSDPLVLILDEPTEGLDPLMQESFYRLLVDVKERGRTVFMSSHVLSEVERVCDRIAVVRQGELVLQSKVAELGGWRRARCGYSSPKTCPSRPAWPYLASPEAARSSRAARVRGA